MMLLKRALDDSDCQLAACTVKNSRNLELLPERRLRLNGRLKQRRLEEIGLQKLPSVPLISSAREHGSLEAADRVLRGEQI
jgi:hypothetical protein